MSWNCVLLSMIVSLVALTAVAEAKRCHKFALQDSEANKLIRSSFDLNYFPADQQTVVSWTTDGVGKIMQANLDKSSGDCVVDFACLESVCSNSPEGELERNRNENQCRTCVFSSSTISNTVSPKTMCYRQFPNLRAYLIYKIPLSFARRYPKVFSFDELRSSSNVSIFMKFESEKQLVDNFHTASCRLMQLSEEWAYFVQRRQTPSRTEIVSFANRLLKKYAGKAGS